MSFLLENCFLPQVSICCLGGLLRGCPTSHTPHFKPWDTPGQQPSISRDTERDSHLRDTHGNKFQPHFVHLSGGSAYKGTGCVNFPQSSEGRTERTFQWVSGYVQPWQLCAIVAGQRRIVEKVCQAESLLSKPSCWEVKSDKSILTICQGRISWACVFMCERWKGNPAGLWSCEMWV